MTLIESAGRALYGPLWPNLRFDLNINERTFRRLATGENYLQDDLLRDIERLLRDRLTVLDAVLLEIMDEHGAPAIAFDH